MYNSSWLVFHLLHRERARVEKQLCNKIFGKINYCRKVDNWSQRSFNVAITVLVQLESISLSLECRSFSFQLFLLSQQLLDSRLLLFKCTLFFLQLSPLRFSLSLSFSQISFSLLKRSLARILLLKESEPRKHRKRNKQTKGLVVSACQQTRSSTASLR